jgi:hypothetical protein
MERMARAMGEKKPAADAAAAQKTALAAFEARFWDAEKGQYSYAFNADGEQVKELTPWCAVPLMWGIGRPERSDWTLEKMNSADLVTEWGSDPDAPQSARELITMGRLATLTDHVLPFFEHGQALQGTGCPGQRQTSLR